MTGDDQETVRPGCRVRISGTHGTDWLTIYDERAPDPFTVRPNTPLGRALMGRKVGETVDIVVHPKLPARQVKIIAIGQ